MIAPRDQPCCGALMVHSGLEDQAAAMARRMIEIFEARGGGHDRDQRGGVRIDDEGVWTSAARRSGVGGAGAAFSAKCRDIAEILCELPPRGASATRCGMRVAYHDACHLRHAQGICASRVSC